MRDILDLLRLFVGLWRATWPVLLLIAACGVIANDLLLPLAVKVGYASAIAGFAVLSLVVLVKLVVIVLMFMTLRLHMPAVTALHAGGAAAVDPAAPASPADRRLLGLIAVAILPFFAYYAAWGFLGDTVREYSLLALSMAPFGERAVILDVPDSRWLFAAILGFWALRRFAKWMKERGARPFWQFVIVLCDTNWIFIGLFVLSRWKDAFWAWIASGGPMPWLIWLRDALTALVGRAQAATIQPVELAAPPLATTLQNLLLYALLPLVWLLMTAVIYGYDVKQTVPLAQHRRVAAALSRYSALPKFLRDFIDHFVAGYRSRYLPVVNTVRLAFGASLPVLLALIVFYRAIGWLGAWSWIGLSRLIGAQDLVTWQMLASAIALLLGGPSDIRGGILVDTLRICLLAAVMERAVASRGLVKAEPEPAPAA
ncbi:hypothetical protein [Bosea sp. (in: a-proteobacteria)]|uniref:hypothetical protein n=1 Tax=Bosea sp. (in: a-proteobacteria) TaxID=1871050 RepID=UPI003F6F2561